MTLRHLEIFRAVCAKESITAAAEQLNMTQPAVSIAVRELESFYQVRLFERMNRRIYITDDGRALLQYAETILDRFNESMDILRHRQTCERIRLGVNATVGETRLAELLRKLQDDSGLDVRVVVDNSRAIEQRLLRNEIDLAVIDELLQPDLWQASVLFTEPMIIAAAPGVLPENGLISVEALSRSNLLLREPGSGSRKCVDAVLQRHGCPVIPVVESASTMTLLNLAEAGLGLAILPRSLFSGHCARRKLRLAELSNDRFDRHFYLIHHPRKYLTTAMLTAIDRLKA